MPTLITAPDNLELSWTLTCAMLVFLMQAGFALLEGGVVRTKNSINVAVKNLLDCLISGLVFSLVGFSLMFGASVGGLFGSPGSVHFLSNGSLTTFFLFQLVFCSTATTILSGAVAERTKLSTFVIVVLCISGFVYPLTGHWCWGGTLPGSGQGWLAEMGFHDFAGATVVHVVGGFAALAAAQMIGPRRFISVTHSSSGHSLVLAVLGCMLIWFGWWGFNGGSQLRMDQHVPLILLNTQLGGIAGGLTVAWLCYKQRRRIEVLPLTLGVISGLVSVTAGCDVLHPAMAAFVGATGAWLAYIADKILKKRGIDDVVSAFPVHGVAGIWGTFAVVFGLDSGSWLEAIRQGLIQFLGTSIVAATSYLSVTAVLAAVRRRMTLRVSEEEEIQGLNISEHGATNEVLDLVLEMNAQREAGDFSVPVTVEPHTEAGQIAEQYNRVIDRVQKEIASHEETNGWLKSERLRLKSVLENVDVGIFQLDPSFQFTEVNSSLLTILGYRTVAELTSLDTDVQPWLIGTDHENLCRTAIVQGDMVHDLETLVTRQDGNEIWITESLIPIRDDSGKLVTWLGTINDVTERKRAMLAEVEIAQAKSEAKGEFLANMSHEIRTPLNGVIGALDLIAASDQAEQQDHYLAIARTSADSLLSLINDVLDFSKIEAGHMELEQIEFDLRDVVESTSEQFAIRAHSKGLELNCDIAANIPSIVIGDPERLRQVLINLMGNAIKFTRDGEINLRLHFDGQRVHFAVEDTGIGMSDEQCARMFEAFTQADASTTREFGGTGLGLSISNQLVKLMGGQLQVRSEREVGSTFFFAIEYPVADSVRPRDLRMDDLLKKQPDSRVLIIDDNATNCEILKAQMNRWGFHSEICQSAELAVNRLKVAQQHGTPFSLVLLDYCMPVMDGASVAKSIRRQRQFDTLPIIMLSSNHELMTREQRAECGVDIAMSKPVRQSRLYDAIVDVLQSRIKNLGSQSSIVVEAQEKFTAAPLAGVEQMKEELLQQLQGRQQTQNSNVVNELPNDGSVQSQSKRPLQSDFYLDKATPPNQCSKVLVAEDNQVNQIVVRQMLKSLGFETEMVDNGQEAIQSLQSTSFQVVLMDGHMPVMDGLTATQKIRQLQQSNALPLNSTTNIIALTANVSSDAKRQFIEAGVDDFISKPVTLHRLEKTLTQYSRTVDSRTVDSRTVDSRTVDSRTVDSRTVDSAEKMILPDTTTLKGAVTDEQSVVSDTLSCNDVMLNEQQVSHAETISACPQLFDDAEFCNRCGGDEGFRRQVLSLMQASLPNTLSEIRGYAAKSDFERTASVAHRLKGAAGDTALVAVSSAAEKTEAAAMQEDADALQATLTELNQRISDTLEFLENHLSHPVE